jgi:hypothetical protein
MDDDSVLSAGDVRAAIAGKASFSAEFRVDGRPVPVTVEIGPAQEHRRIIGWFCGWLSMDAADYANYCDYYHVIGVLAFGDVAIPVCVQGRPHDRTQPRLAFMSAGPPRLDVPEP